MGKFEKLFGKVTIIKGSEDPELVSEAVNFFNENRIAGIKELYPGNINKDNYRIYFLRDKRNKLNCVIITCVILGKNFPDGIQIGTVVLRGKLQGKGHFKSIMKYLIDDLKRTYPQSHTVEIIISRNLGIAHVDKLVEVLKAVGLKPVAGTIYREKLELL